MTPLEQRAFSAYFRSSEAGATIENPCAHQTIDIDGKQYIVLSGKDGILAVYRIRIVNGDAVLKRLKRYPKELQ